MLSGVILWCLKCGAYGSDRAAGFGKPCAGSPLISWGGSKLRTTLVGRTVQLSRLRAGRRPSLLIKLPQPIPEPRWRQAPLPPAGDGGDADGAVPAPATSASERLSAVLLRIRAKEAAAAADAKALEEEAMQCQ